MSCLPAACCPEMLRTARLLQHYCLNAVHGTRLLLQVCWAMYTHQVVVIRAAEGHQRGLVWGEVQSLHLDLVGRGEACQH